jgi:hypothetical protein
MKNWKQEIFYNYLGLVQGVQNTIKVKHEWPVLYIIHHKLKYNQVHPAFINQLPTLRISSLNCI